MGKESALRSAPFLPVSRVRGGLVRTLFRRELGSAVWQCLRFTSTVRCFDPGTLASATLYYRRIDEVNASGTTTGVLWSFTTR